MRSNRSMGSITASPAAPDLELADFIDIDIDQPISLEALTRILSKPPFRIVEGGFNIRLPEQVKLFWQPQIRTPAPGILSNFAANNDNDAYRDMCSSELIARDYALTRVGIETEYLVRSLQQAWPECAAGAVGFKEFSDTTASYMMAFLGAVKVKYGGMEKFVVDVIGMSKADVEALWTVLRGKS
ncbi:hypothetical protein CNMCM5793_007657 [Aspergillus hiratsukae]|uniref:Uncharacterized protein n=1 Tax=Aspergillus hiratsukae TaxID=1194566 RepID=A0A8H6UE13_9EURO|nr:hypothetical protein CNMCM5793_007657 [Aspergillus hiratsukae]KAF7158363.1 hypothetical protein CNMCM6106_004859 [Aspergillus hiratsukae]